MKIKQVKKKQSYFKDETPILNSVAGILKGVSPTSIKKIKEERIAKKHLIMKIKNKPADRHYYDTHGVLKDIVDEDIDMSLEDTLRKDILTGKRKRTLRKDINP